MTWVTGIIFYLKSFSRGHGDKSINQSMKILTKSWVELESIFKLFILILIFKM